jgi:hypothetical protein
MHGFDKFHDAAGKICNMECFVGFWSELSNDDIALLKVKKIVAYS